MNSDRWRINAARAIGPPLIVLGLLTTRPDAAHFSWLGHTACPGEPAQCESQVPAGFKALGDFEYGFYRTLDEASAEWRGEERTETLHTRDGHPIARVGARFRRQLDIDGSARLRDGRLVSVEGKVDGQSRFLVIEHAPFGVGAPGYQLMPYRTVSVDPKRISLGTVLFIPALVGVRLPTGEFHDGFCFAHDTHEGAADGIGIFAGFDRDANRTFMRPAAKKPLRVYQADPDAAAVLNRRFKDQFDWTG
jgi:3D (Asp-Asp-Asp) domain-containing protein